MVCRVFEENNTRIRGCSSCICGCVSRPFGATNKHTTSGRCKHCKDILKALLEASKVYRVPGKIRKCECEQERLSEPAIIAALARQEEQRQRDLIVAAHGFNPKTGLHFATQRRTCPRGFGMSGIHSLTYTLFNPQGFDWDGNHENGSRFGPDNRDWDSCCKRGFQSNGMHRNGTPFDERGFDINGDHLNGSRFGPDGRNVEGSKYGYYGFGADGTRVALRSHVLLLLKNRTW